LSPGHADDDRGGVIEQPTLAETIRGCFATFGGVDLELPPPRVVDEPSSFDRNPTSIAMPSRSDTMGPCPALSLGCPIRSIERIEINQKVMTDVITSRCREMGRCGAILLKNSAAKII
jgi:hypothetical protein